MTSWETPAHIVWNGLMVLVWLSALAGIVHPRSRPLRAGWKSKVLWVLPLLVAVWFGGYWFPLGAFPVLRQIRKGWKGLELEATNDAVPATSGTSDDPRSPLGAGST